MTAICQPTCNYDTFTSSIIPLCQQFDHFPMLVCSLKNEGVNIKKVKRN